MQTDYVFQFRPVWVALPRLLDGALLTLQLSVAVICIGLAIGIVCALARSSRRRWLRWPVAVYVEAIRNTPFLIQLFFIYFGLPTLTGVNHRPSTLWPYHQLVVACWTPVCTPGILPTR